MKIKAKNNEVKYYSYQNLLSKLFKNSIKPNLLLECLINFIERFFLKRGFKHLYNPKKEIVGAATLSFWSFYHCILKKNYRIFWTQKCHRPSDFRNVHNNINLFSRSSVHTQFQILINPKIPLKDLQNILIELVIELGLNPIHLRFIEDNWSSPIISAYGVGCEATFNSIEIAQLTNFYSFAGIEVGVNELVIGLERLLFVLLEENNIKNNMITYPYQDRYYFKIFKEKSLNKFRIRVIEFLRLSTNSLNNWGHIIRLSHLLNLINLNKNVDGILRLFLLKKVQKKCNLVIEKFMV